MLRKSDEVELEDFKEHGLNTGVEKDLNIKQRKMELSLRFI